MKEPSSLMKWVCAVIIGVLMTYCGAVIVSMGVQGHQAYSEATEFSEKAEATVSEVRTDKTWHGNDQYLTADYKANDMDYSFVFKRGIFNRDLEEGSQLTALYDPLQPLLVEVERTSFGELWGYYFVGGGTGILVGTGIIVYGVIIRKRKS